MYSTSVMVNANGGSMRKGFTLIELLAVIIVLAVIALIATPIVLDVVDSAKLKAFEESTYGIMETVKLKNYDDMLENSDKIYTFPNDELVFQGERPKGGTVISQNGNTAIAIHNGKYCATKKFGDEKVTITENIENCDLKQFSLDGNISAVETYPGSENYNQAVKVKGKVQLIKNNKIIYETTSDESGNYSFDKVVSDNYLILVSQPYRTKYGEEINLNSDTTKDIEATLQYGDFNNDNIISDYDTQELYLCYNQKANDECRPYDFNADGNVDLSDLDTINSLIGKASSLKLNENNFSIKGKIMSDKNVTFGGRNSTISLKNEKGTYSIKVDSDGNFSLENIPSGAYNIKYNGTPSGYGLYSKYIVLDRDLDLEINLYYGVANFATHNI